MDHAALGMERDSLPAGRFPELLSTDGKVEFAHLCAVMARFKAATRIVEGAGTKGACSVYLPAVLLSACLRVSVCSAALRAACLPCLHPHACLLTCRHACHPTCMPSGRPTQPSLALLPAWSTSSAKSSTSLGAHSCPPGLLWLREGGCPAVSDPPPDGVASPSSAV